MPRYLLALVLNLTLASSALAEWPSSTTTGVPAGEILSASGSFTVTTDGQVISNLDITGTLTIRADNVVVRNCRINANGAFYGLNYSGHANILVEDTEIFGASSSGLLGFGSGVFRRLHLHNSSDNSKFGGNITLEDSYIHDYIVTATSHNDGVQIRGGSNIRFIGNRVDGPFRLQTSAFIIQTGTGAIDNVLFLGNRLSGGTYTLYLRDKNAGFGPPSNVSIINNVWQTDSYGFGPLSANPGPNWSWVGNSFTDGSEYSNTGYPIPLGSYCGDGNNDADEECDDGNPSSDDGCSASCKLEGGSTPDSNKPEAPKILRQATN